MIVGLFLLAMVSVGGLLVTGFTVAKIAVKVTRHG